MDLVALKIGETTDPDQTHSAETVAALEVVADTATTEVVVEEVDTVVVAVEEDTEGEGVEVVMTMGIHSGEVAEEATIMAMEVEEVGVPEEDGEETTEMTKTEMMAPTGAEAVIEMAVIEVTSLEATEEETEEATEVTTDILHEGNL